MSTSVDVYVHELLEHQEPDAQHPARFKVMVKGRRWGKDRFALHVALLGHGPEVKGRRQWPGVLDGWDVVWLTKDYPQGQIIWDEEIVPRFKGHDLIGVNEQDHAVRFSTLGGLYVKSFENVDSIRGIGKNLKGVVINEAAHFDLRRAWRAVIRPMLVDNKGWAVIMSTTNAGHDGNPEKLTPSFFNRLADDVRMGRRGPEWALFTGTAFDNPSLDPAEVRALVDEYPAGSIELDQEVYAKLLPGRHGVVFSQWRDDLHVIDTFRVPPYWRWIGGLDWGHRAPGCFVLFACGPDGDVIGVDEFYFNDGPPDTKLHARDAGYAVGQLCRHYPMPEYIAGDEQMWYKSGASGLTVAEDFLQGLQSAYGEGNPHPALIEAVHGRGSRAIKLQVFHRMLAWKALKKGDAGFDAAAKQRGALRFDGGIVPPWYRPKLRFTRLCKACLRTIPKLTYDPKTKKEDVDTTQEDHPYDAVGAGLLSRTPVAERPETPRSEDQHPGFTKRGRKKPGLVADELARDQGGRPPWAGRFRLPPGVEPVD